MYENIHTVLFTYSIHLYASMIYIILILHTVQFVTAQCECNNVERSKNDILNFISRDATLAINSKESSYCSSNLSPKSEAMFDDDMTKIEEGNYMIGDSQLLSDSDTSHKMVYVNEYYIDKYEVSNAQFDDFVQNTGYVTTAELFGNSFIFEGLLTQSQKQDYSNSRIKGAIHWYKVNNTFWRQPEGISSTIIDRMDHPVVHVSWMDAVKFCNWKRKRLPSEVEWEVACRGGKKNRLFPWGNKFKPKNQFWLNIWQGVFPVANSMEDGYFSTNPVNVFRQNDYDLYNMVGNVWEWTSSALLANENEERLETIERVKKGGSYLCHKSYCYRYRCGARSTNTADSTAGNLGFRCARTI